MTTRASSISTSSSTRSWRCTRFASSPCLSSLLLLTRVLPSLPQILSSENWTTILQTVLASERGQFQVVVAAIFLCGWMFFSFCALPPLLVLILTVADGPSPAVILGNLFIALINENFSIAEEEKRARQVEAFVNRTAVQEQTAGWFRRFDPYTYATAKSKTMSVASPAPLVDEPEEIPDRNLTASPDMLDDSPTDEKTPQPQSASASSTRFLHKATKSLRFQSGIDSVSNYIAPSTPDVDRSRYRHPR